MSLKEQGLIGKPSAPMLLVNGDRDSQVPIADLDLLLHAGSPKEAWVNPGGGHMGRSADMAGRKDLPAGRGAVDRPATGQRRIAGGELSG